MMSGGAMLNDEPPQVGVSARKAFFERRRCGKDDSAYAGNLEMVDLGPPPRVPTPPAMPTGFLGAKKKTGNLAPIIRTNKDFLTGPLF